MLKLSGSRLGYTPGSDPEITYGNSIPCLGSTSPNLVARSSMWLTLKPSKMENISPADFRPFSILAVKDSAP